jgi:hypothetical protein
MCSVQFWIFTSSFLCSQEEWYWYLDFVLVQAWIPNWIAYGVLDMVFFVVLEYWFCFEQVEIIG